MRRDWRPAACCRSSLRTDLPVVGAMEASITVGASVSSPRHSKPSENGAQRKKRKRNKGRGDEHINVDYSRDVTGQRRLGLNNMAPVTFNSQSEVNRMEAMFIFHVLKIEVCFHLKMKTHFNFSVKPK